jgi:hypothetical protein
MRTWEDSAEGRLLTEQLAGEHSAHEPWPIWLTPSAPAAAVAMALTAGTVARTVPHRSMGRF